MQAMQNPLLCFVESPNHIPHLAKGVVCFIPDPGSGKAHLELGMISQFMVQ
jgi:hypothetical protein